MKILKGDCRYIILVFANTINGGSYEKSVYGFGKNY